MPDSNARALIPSVTSLADYRKQGGYQMLQAAQGQAIMQATRQAVLRGRGGAGMPVAGKWQAVRAAVEQRGGTPFLVCNAYDADPLSMVASLLLARQPHRVLEGIALAARAIGAHETYLYLHATNKEGYDAVTAALREAHDAGVLGDLVVTLVGVDAGFMGGEESTMLEVIKGRRAMAKQRPPYPAQSGLGEMPTAVANVETLAHLPAVVRDPAGYAKTGTPATPGTKFVTVYDAGGAGQVLEIPFGTTIAAILRSAGIAVSPQTARGVVVGGPEGGVLPLEQLAIPFDFEPLKAAGAIVGSGTLQVLGATTCMVEWARQQTAYLAKESCGKCIPCRSGTKRIEGTLEGIMSDVGASGDLDLLNEFADYVPEGSLCGFGWNATNPLRSAMRWFAADFQSHLQGTCPTGTCVPSRSHRFAKKGVL